MSIEDRRAAGYQPRWDIDSKVGAQGEFFVVDIIQALENGSSEVKTDEKAAQYQNIYLEYQCRVSGQWCPSGLATTEAELWNHVLLPGPIAITVPVPLLRDVARHHYAAGHRREAPKGSHPTRGITIPLACLLRDLLAAAGGEPA